MPGRTTFTGRQPIRGMSQAELGERVGLNADRIQKYENGQRRPKLSMTKQIADALDVEPAALLDPVLSSYIGAMYGLFEMEDLYDLKVSAEGGKVSLVFGDGISGTMNERLREWYEKIQSVSAELSGTTENSRNEALKAYHQWKWTYPREQAQEDAQAIRKARLKSRIQELQDELKKMNGD